MRNVSLSRVGILVGAVALPLLLGGLAGCGGGGDDAAIQGVVATWTEAGSQTPTVPLDTGCTQAVNNDPCEELAIKQDGTYTLKPSSVPQPPIPYFEESGTWTTADGTRLLLTQTALWVDNDRNGVKDEDTEVVHSPSNPPKYEFDVTGKQGNLYSAVTGGFDRTHSLVFETP